MIMKALLCVEGEFYKKIPGLRFRNLEFTASVNYSVDI